MEQLPTRWLHETRAMVYRGPDTARRAKKLMGCYGWECVAESPVAVKQTWWQRLLGRSSPNRVRIVYQRPYAARPYGLFHVPPHWSPGVRPQRPDAVGHGG
jgi:hypothetical protein